MQYHLLLHVIIITYPDIYATAYFVQMTAKFLKGGGGGGLSIGAYIFWMPEKETKKTTV